MKLNSKYKGWRFSCFVLVIFLYSCLTEQGCKETVNYYNSIEFHVVIEGPRSAEPNYYEMEAKDILLNKSGKVNIDRGLASIVLKWSIGDTLFKNKGNTIVILKKKKSVLGTRIFVSEWTCNGGTINGKPVDTWVSKFKEAGLTEDSYE